jgi:hypothetical protein
MFVSQIISLKMTKEIITGPEPAPVVDVIYEEIKHRLPTTYDEVFTFTKIYQPINTSLN